MTSQKSKTTAKVKALVLVDCVVCGEKFKSGGVIEGSNDDLKAYIGVELDNNAAAVKYALSQGAEVKSIIIK